MPDVPAGAITAAATASYFAATEDGPFDHQRDAYEQGYADGAKAAAPALRAQGAAAERACIRALANDWKAEADARMHDRRTYPIEGTGILTRCAEQLADLLEADLIRGRGTDD